MALLFVAAVATAQNPTPTQVQQALQQQPGLADMVRGRIAQSGLTPDQIRAAGFRIIDDRSFAELHRSMLDEEPPDVAALFRIAVATV